MKDRHPLDCPSSSSPRGSFGSSACENLSSRASRRSCQIFDRDDDPEGSLSSTLLGALQHCDAFRDIQSTDRRPLRATQAAKGVLSIELPSRMGSRLTCFNSSRSFGFVSFTAEESLQDVKLDFVERLESCRRGTNTLRTCPRVASSYHPGRIKTRH